MDTSHNQDSPNADGPNDSERRERERLDRQARRLLWFAIFFAIAVTALLFYQAHLHLRMIEALGKMIGGG